MQVPREALVQALGREDPLEEGTAAHCNILAWRIPWTEDSMRLQSTGLQRVGHDLAIEQLRTVQRDFLVLAQGNSRQCSNSSVYKWAWNSCDQEQAKMLEKEVIWKSEF